jgi:opacity protein-like surface antigen
MIGALSLSSPSTVRILVALLTGFLLASSAEADSPTPYLQELIQHARQARLADEREWRLLLHYRADWFGGYTSEQDDSGFFMSQEGKTDPQAELDATLAQFFSADLVGRSKQPAQCAFAARYAWLKERLAFDPTRLEPLHCERFERWIEEFHAESVSLIFPSAFMNNPASMFGHTFLRIDQKGQTPQTRLLAYTINFAADVPPAEGLIYPIRGIFGGYRGYFSTIPYYLKVQEYRDIENRDIWEYRLNFTEQQVRRLLMHAWELGNAGFDYFFFKENCSYHLLSLLEYADPSLHLTDQFLFWTVPADTVRLLAAKPGLVSDIAFRPSRVTLIRRKREHLSEPEQKLVQRIVRNASESQSEAIRSLPLSRQAFVLDVASDYVRYMGERDEEIAATARERNRQILTARSLLRIPSEDLSILPFSRQPESGHKTSRASLGGGWRNDDTFEEITLRAGYHDLLDPETGYTPGAQIEVGSISLRRYNRADQTRIERVTLLNLLSLSPMDRLFHAPSWKFNLGMQTINHRGCDLCSNWNINGGIGASTETHLLRREVWFVFAEAEGNYSRAYEELHRIGGGASAGFYADFTEQWRILASAGYLRYALGDKSDDFRWSVGQRYTLAQNWALRLEYNHRDHDNDVLFSVQRFF